MTITFTLVSLWFSSIHINKQPKIFLAWIINRLSKTLIIFGYYSHVKCIKKDSSKEARRHLVNACFNPCDLIGFERTMRDSLKNLLLMLYRNLFWLCRKDPKKLLLLKTFIRVYWRFLAMRLLADNTNKTLKILQWWN